MRVEQSLAPMRVSMDCVESVGIDALESGKQHSQCKDGETDHEEKSGVAVGLVQARLNTYCFALRFGIGQCCSHDAQCQTKNGQYLHARIAPAVVYISNQHRSHWSAGSKYDMQRNRYPVCERPVVQKIDGHEECCINSP